MLFTYRLPFVRENFSLKGCEAQSWRKLSDTVSTKDGEAALEWGFIPVVGTAVTLGLACYNW